MYLVSKFENLAAFVFPNWIPRWDAINWANSPFEEPENNLIFDIMLNFWLDKFKFK